tara:strand:+ start:262 stop:465 length:204 start_codon:yes stop_codon:yes gene_type:complete
MEQELANEKILEKLTKIEADIDMLKERIIDSDGVLTEEGESELEEALEDHRRGETISLEDLKKELGD